MMMQMLNPNENAANAVCCNCFKVKKRKCQRSSRTCCKCRKSKAHNKQKNCRRKLKTSCLKTIVHLANMAKRGGERQGCSYDSGCQKVVEDVDERFCSKCGQLLPGMIPSDPPLHQPDPCIEQLQRCQQESKDMGVQVGVEQKQPLSVHIKVCPCPNVDQTRQDEKLYRSVSVPELSRTNPRLVDDATSSNLVNARVLHTRFEDRNNDESRRAHQLKGFSETKPEWPTDLASVKKLVLNLAKARLVEEAKCWDREHLHRYQDQQQFRDEHEQPTDEASEIDPKKSADADGGPGFQNRSFVSSEYGRGQTPSTPRFRSQIPRSTYPNYNNQTRDLDICNEYPGTTDFSVLYTPRQDVADGSCAGTDSYCYSPGNTPSPFGDHCEQACTCGNAVQFHSNDSPQPYSGYPYQNIPHQQEYFEQDRFKPDPYNWSSGSLAGNRPRSPCR